MRLLPERTHSSIILLASLAIILVALAALQYKWSGQVSEAEKERMQTSLHASLNQFRLQCNNEFRQLAFLIQPDATVLLQRDWKAFAATSDAAIARSDLRLIRHIYLWIAGIPGKSELYRLNRDARAFEVTQWPAGFEKVRERYASLFANPHRPEPALMPFRWTMFSGIPLMVQSLLAWQPSPQSSGAAPQFVGCLLIELNREAIFGELLPQLAKRHFEGPDGFIYQIGVVDKHHANTLIYRSDPNLTVRAFDHADARISLFERPRERFGPPGARLGSSPEQPDPLAPEPGRDSGPLNRDAQSPPMIPLRRGPPPMQQAYLTPPLFDDSSLGWELMAKHREGSLEVAIARIRRRNLAVSMGSLVLLAISMAFILVSARRAQRLARLQIDFVAGISHELRTPLSVICSAGDNLAEGIIEHSSQSIRKYGNLIRDEGRKLAGMIDQILQFASLHRAHKHFSLHPESINEIADSALQQMHPVLEAAGFSVEKTFADNLPRIHVDAAALSRVIQNLVQNALKYSGDTHWLAVRTAKAEAKRGAEVQLMVEDRGLGISSEDLPQIFKPFYRGSVAAAAQIHGAGLGLFLVRETLVSMGGSIGVKSVPGKGSVFTLHLPALSATNDSPVPAASEE